MFLKEKLAEDKLINSMEIVLVCHVADSLQEKTIFLTEKKKVNSTQINQNSKHDYSKMKSKRGYSVLGTSTHEYQKVNCIFLQGSADPFLLSCISNRQKTTKNINFSRDPPR